MSDDELIAQYGGYTDAELATAIVCGIPEWQARAFEHLIALRSQSRSTLSSKTVRKRPRVDLIAILWAIGVLFFLISLAVFPLFLGVIALATIVVAMALSAFRLYRKRTAPIGLLGISLHLTSVVGAFLLLPCMSYAVVHRLVIYADPKIEASSSGEGQFPRTSEEAQANFLKDMREIDPDFEKPSTNVDSGYVQRLQSNPNAFVETPDAGRAADPALNEKLRKQYPASSYAPDYRAFGRKPPPAQ